MRSSARHHLSAVVALFVGFVAVYAPFIFRDSQQSPYRIFHWDFYSQFYPWLVYTSDSLRAGIWPFWAPYVGGGTPFFLNPQNPLYSPITWLVSLTVGYTHYTAQLQGLVHLLMGSLGAYTLAYALWRSRAGAMVTALSFGLSSALFGNMQHYSYLNVYALMPWTFLAIMRLVQGRRGALAGLVTVFYLLIVTGYPAVVFMTLAWGGGWALFLLRQTGLSAAAQRLTLIKGIGAGIVAVGLSAVYWLPILAYKDEFTRGKALSIDQALIGGNLAFKHIWNLFFSFLTSYPFPGTNADISMRGIYIGAIALPLVGVAVLRRRDAWTAALGLFSAGTFLMACGGEFFGRVALHTLLPAFNFSRFPAGDSRALFVLGLALLAGRGMQAIGSNDAEALEMGRRGLYTLIVVIIGGLFFFPTVYPHEIFFDKPLNVMSISLALSIGALALWPSLASPWARKGLLALLLIDLGIGVHTNIDLIGDKPGNYGELRALHQRTFPVEAASRPRELGTTGSLLEPGQNEPASVGYVSKTFYVGDYNPLRSRRLNHLLASGMTDWLRRGPRVVGWPDPTLPRTPAAFFARQRPVSFSISAYGPNAVTYHVRLPKETWVVFNELYFPGWRIKGGSEDMAMAEVLGGLRGARLEAGEYDVTTYFLPSIFWKGLAVSLATLLLSLLWLAWGGVQGRRNRRKGGMTELGSEVPASIN